MADKISQIYSKATQKGVLADGMTEDQFREKTSTEKGLRSFYNYATTHGMKFHEFDVFKQNFYGDGEQEEQPAEQHSEQQQVTEQPQVSKRQTSWLAGFPEAGIAMQGEQQYNEVIPETKQRMDQDRREQYATLPLTPEDVATMTSSARIPIGDSYGFVPDENGIPRFGKIEQQKPKAEESPKVPMKREESYLNRQEKTMDDVLTNVVESWTANTEEGKAARKSYEDGVAEAIAYYTGELKKYQKTIQGKVNRGEMSVEDANTALNAQGKNFEEKIKQAEKEGFESYIDAASEANKDYINKKYREIGNTIVKERLADDIPAVEEAIKNYAAKEESYKHYHRQDALQGNYHPKYATESGYLKEAKEILEDAKKLQDAALYQKNGWVGFGQTIADKDTWDLGIGQAIRSIHLKKIVDKLDANNGNRDVLTKEEKTLLDAYSTYLQASAFNSKRLSTWYKAGQTTAEAVPFILQVAATSGLGAGNSLALTIFKAATNAGQSALTHAALRGVAVFAGGLVDSAIQTALFSVPKIVSGTTERMMGDIKIGVDDKNRTFTYDGVDEKTKQSLGEAIANASWEEFHNNWSERILEAANPMTKLLGTRGIMSQVFASIGSPNWANAILSFASSPQLRALKKRIHWGGYAQELLEEETDNFMSLLSSDIDMSNAGFDLDSQIDIMTGLIPMSLTFGLIGGAKAGAHYVKMAHDYHDIKKSLSTEAEKDLFESLFKESRSGEFGIKAHELIRGIVTNSNYTPTQRMRAMEAVLGRYYEVLSDELKGKISASAEAQFGEEIDTKISTMTNDKSGQIYQTVDKDGRPVVITDGKVETIMVNEKGKKVKEGGIVLLNAGKSQPKLGVRFVKPDGTIEEEPHQVDAFDLPFPVMTLSPKEMRDKHMAAYTSGMLGQETYEYAGKTYDTSTGKEVEKPKEQPAAQQTQTTAPETPAPAEPKKQVLSTGLKPIKKTIKVLTSDKKQVDVPIQFMSSAYTINEDGSISADAFSILQNGKPIKGNTKKQYFEALNDVFRAEKRKADEEAEKKREEEDFRQSEEGKRQAELAEMQAQLEQQKAEMRESVKGVTRKNGEINLNEATPEQVVFFLLEHNGDNRTVAEKATVDIATSRIVELHAEKDKKGNAIEKWQIQNKIDGYYAAIQKWIGTEATESARAAVNQALNITEDEVSGTIEGEGKDKTEEEGKPKPKKETKKETKQEPKEEPKTEKLEARSDEIYDHIKVETTKNENTGLTDYVYIPYAKAEEGQEPQPVKLAGKFINRNIITGGDAKEFIDEQPNDIRDIQVTNVKETSEKDIFVANVIITTKDGKSAGYTATLNTLPKVGSTKREQKPSTPPTEAPETKTPKKPKATPKWPNPFDKDIALVKTANGRVVFKSRAEIKDGETGYEPRIVYVKEGNKYVKYAVRSTKPKIGVNSTVPVADANGVEKMVYANQLFADEQGTPFVTSTSTKLKVDNFGQVAAYPVYTSANGTQFTLKDLLREHKRKIENAETKTTKTESISGYEYVRQQVEAENPGDAKAVEDLNKNINHILDMWNALAAKLLDSRGYNKTMMLAYRYLYYKNAIETQYNLAAEAEKEGKDASKFYAEAHKIDANMDGKVDFSIGSGFDARNLSGRWLNNPLYRLTCMIEITKDMPEMKGVEFEMQLPEDIEKALNAKIITAKQIEKYRDEYKKLSTKKEKTDADVDRLEKLEKLVPEVKTAWTPLTREQSENGFEKVKPLLKQEAGETRRNKKLSKEQEALIAFRNLCQQALDALKANDIETFNKLNAQIGKTVTEHMADKVNKFKNQMVSYQNNIRTILTTAYPDVAEIAKRHKRLDNAISLQQKRISDVEAAQERVKRLEGELEGLKTMGDTEDVLKQIDRTSERLESAKDDLLKKIELRDRPATVDIRQLTEELSTYQAEHPEAEKQYQEMQNETYPENGLRLDLMADEYDMLTSMSNTSEWGAKHGKHIVDLLRGLGIQIDIVSHEELLAMLPENTKLLLLQNNNTLYGLADGKRVWLNRDTMNTNVPVHESVHLWVHAFAINHSEEWKAMIETLKQTDMWKKVTSHEVYSKYSDNDNKIANEVMARLVGDYYAQRGMFSLSLFEEQADKTLVAKAARIIRKVLNYIFDKFGWTLPVNRSKDFSREVRRLLAMPINDIIAYGGERGAIIAKANAKQKLPGWIRPAADVDMMTRRTDETIRGWLANRGDLDANTINAVLHAIDELESNKLQLAAGKWYANGKVRLPEDLKKIRQAVAVAERAKVDPMRYDSPMAIIEAFPEIEIKEKPIDPDTVPSLHKVAEFDNGIVIYDVEDSFDARIDMRNIINTHFGKDCSPWCLLQGDENGELTEESEYYWQHYNAYPKQVAFKDGHLVAFSANDSEEKVWWNRMDISDRGIDVGKVSIGDGKTQERMFIPQNGEYDTIGPVERISDNGRLQEHWDREGKYRTSTKIETANGTVRIGYQKGNNRISFISLTNGNFHQSFNMSLSGSDVVTYDSDTDLRGDDDFDFISRQYVERTGDGYLTTEFDSDGNVRSVRELSGEKKSAVNVEFRDGETDILIAEDIDGTKYSYDAASIHLIGDRVVELRDLENDDTYLFDEQGNVFGIEDHVTNKYFEVSNEGTISFGKRGGDMRHVSSSSVIHAINRTLSKKFKEGKELLEKYQDRYEGLLEYASVADESMFENTVKERLKEVLADAFGLSSTDNILSADQNGVLDGLNLMTDLDMMVEEGVAYQYAESELSQLDEPTEKRIRKEEDQGTEHMLDPDMSDQERESWWESVVTRIADQSNGMRLMLNSINAYRKLQGLEPLDMDKYDVRTKFEACRSVIANKVGFLERGVQMELDDTIREFADIVENSQFYKKYMKEVGGEKPTVLSPVQIIERYLMARNNWERAKEGVARGLAEFKERMGYTDENGAVHHVGVIEFANEFKDAFGEKAVLNLWDKVRAMTDFALDTNFEGGMISEELYQELKAKKFYVPQRGFWDDVNPENEEEGKEDLLQRRQRGNSIARNKLDSMHKAEGGKSLAEGCLAYIARDARQAIKLSEENKVKKVMFDLLRDNEDWCHLPEHNFKVPRQVFYTTNEEGEIVRMDDGPTEEQRKLMNQLKGIIKELKAQYQKADTDEERDAIQEEIYATEAQFPYFDEKDSYRILHTRAKTNKALVGLYINGVPCEIEMTPRFIQTADALNGRRDKRGEISALKTVTSWLSAQFTMNNPTFFAVNITRDTPLILTKGAVEYGPEFSARFAANWAVSQHAIWTYLLKGEIANTDTGAQLRDFLMNGGNTGYSNLEELERWRRRVSDLNPGGSLSISEIADKLSTLKGAKELGADLLKGTLKVGDKAIGWAELRPLAKVLNEWSEIISRFSAYKSVVDMGLGVNEGIKAAHNLSTNFNRRGLGAPFINFFNSLTVFANAGIQGASGYWRTLDAQGGAGEKAKKIAKTAAYMGMLPAFLGFVATMFNPDDDEYEYMVSEYERDNYIVLGDKRLALNEQLKPWWVIGVNAALLCRGKRTLKQASNSVLTSMFTNWMPLPQNLTGSINMLTENIAGKEEWNIAQIARQAIMPSAMQTMNQWADNKNFLGGKLRYDIGDIPEYEMAPNEAALYRDLAKVFYAWGGGNELVPSKTKEDGSKIRRWWDVNPKEIKSNTFWIPSGALDNFCLAYGLAKDVKERIEGDYHGTNVRVKDLPVINRFYKPSDKTLYRYAVVREARDIVQRHDDRINNLEKQVKHFSDVYAKTGTEEAKASLDEAKRLLSEEKRDVTATKMKKVLDKYNKKSIRALQNKLGESNKEVELYHDGAVKKLDDTEYKLVQMLTEGVNLKTGLRHSTDVPEWIQWFDDNSGPRQDRRE